MTVQWIPGHTEIDGNEIADKKAKKQAKLLPFLQARKVQTLSNAKRRIKKGKDNAWRMEWQTNGSSGAVQAYKDLGLIPTTRIKSLPELTMKLEVQGWLIAARSGHGHFAAYHERFQYKEETDTNSMCGQKRAQLHPFSYPLERTHRALLECRRTHRELQPEEVLGSLEGIAVFVQWAPATGLFNRRYKDVDEEEQGAIE